MEDLENQVEQLSQSRAAGELDVLAATPLPALHAALKALTTAVKVSPLQQSYDAFGCWLASDHTQCLIGCLSFRLSHGHTSVVLVILTYGIILKIKFL